MTDQCKNCTVRGDLPACLVTPCFQHENWYSIEQQKRINELQAENAKYLNDFRIQQDKIIELTDENARLQQSLNQVMMVNTLCKRVEALELAYKVVDSACIGWGMVFDLDNPQKSLNDLIRMEIEAAKDPLINSDAAKLQAENARLKAGRDEFAAKVDALIVRIYENYHGDMSEAGREIIKLANKSPEGILAQRDLLSGVKHINDAITFANEEYNEDEKGSSEFDHLRRQGRNIALNHAFRYTHKLTKQAEEL